MFFYLLKNSTVIEQELDENTRNTKILIYGTVAYIVLHATLFIGGDDALLNCLKPYFWLFVILDLSINTINSDIHFGSIFTKPEVPVSLNRTNKSTGVSRQLNNVFDSFLKSGEIDGNKRLSQSRDTQPNVKRKSIQKKVRFQTEDGYSSSDSDIGTDIDMESFKESLNSL
jgi:hypothetical protein